MTLADLIQQPISYETSKDLALVFSSELAAQFSTIQYEHGSRFVALPVDLIDGRKMLCADLLTEVGPGGLYAQGFAHLPAELFQQVQILPMTGAVALIPQPEEI
jgi:hypothetical protein